MTPLGAGAGLAAGGVVLLAHHGLAGRAPRRPRPADSMATGGGAIAPAWFVQLLAAEGVRARPELVWGRLRAAALATIVAAAAAGGLAMCVAATLLVLAAPRVLVSVADRRRLRRRDAQLPGALERLAAALRAGDAPGPAFRAIAATTPAPLGVDLRVVALEVEHGAPLGDALDRWGAGTSADIRLATTALALAARTGGAVARPVDQVAATLRERHELHAEVRALATQARASAGVLTMAPAGFALLVSTVEPGVLRFLLGTSGGLLCLLLGLAMQGLGAAWTARILRDAS